MSARDKDGLSRSPLSAVDAKFYGLWHPIAERLPVRTHKCPACGRSCARRGSEVRCKKCVENGVEVVALFDDEPL